MNIEASLGLNVFKIDKEPHVTINQEICQTKCQIHYCLHICPASVYTLDRQGEVQAEYEGCLECGTCLIACPHDALTWDYPRAGYGVQYRFG
jgi:ferredoxin like protein